jgi:hypothetical protein
MGGDISHIIYIDSWWIRNMETKTIKKFLLQKNSKLGIGRKCSVRLITFKIKIIFQQNLF